jgi:hypothetical protein
VSTSAAQLHAAVVVCCFYSPMPLQSIFEVEVLHVISPSKKGREFSERQRASATGSFTKSEFGTEFDAAAPAPPWRPRSSRRDAQKDTNVFCPLREEKRAAGICARPPLPSFLCGRRRAQPSLDERGGRPGRKEHTSCGARLKRCFCAKLCRDGDGMRTMRDFLWLDVRSVPAAK